MITMRNERFSINNLPIRDKLIIHFLLISILPSMALGLLTGITVDRIMERQVNEHTLQLIGKVNDALEHYVVNIQNITYFVSFDPEVQRFLNGEPADASGGPDEHYGIRRFLQGFTTLYSEIAGILVVSSRGDYISNELYVRTDKSLTEEDWYKKAVEHQGIFTIIGHPSGRNLTSHVNYRDNEVVSVVRAILDPDTQKVKGVVLIDLKLRVIAETVKDVRLGKTGYLTVIDQSGNIIYSPSQSEIGQIPLEWFTDSNFGTLSKRVDGKNLQLIYRKSAFTGWITIGVFSTRDTVPEVREIRFYMIGFVFLVCLLGIGASHYLAYSMSKPIGQLISYMRKAESGDLTIRHWGNRTDEVGMLGRSYTNMLTQVKKLLALTELQERQKREAELRSLQAQIKPHFLYNTLDTIHWLARRQNAVEVAELVESLSKLFRIGLSKGQDMIPLADELEHIRSYLKIQSTRYRDKLTYSLDIAENVHDAQVLKIVLQPIVENAIYHGIKERRGPGHIAITAEESHGNLLMRIADDGAGMSAERLAELRRRLEHPPDAAGAAKPPGLSGQPGYGLVNVQERIRLTFGAGYGIRIDSAPGRGTEVTIVHPLIRGQSDAEEYGKAVDA